LKLPWGNKRITLKKFRSIDPVTGNGKDGLLLITDCSIQVAESGKPHIRNICMAFDLHLKLAVHQK
jgi:hypothetical protein